MIHVIIYVKVFFYAIRDHKNGTLKIVCSMDEIGGQTFEGVSPLVLRVGFSCPLFMASSEETH